MKKIILGIVALLIVAGAYLCFNLDSIVKRAIETAGTHALGTSVSVSGVNISLANRSATMSGLHVANPKGFQSDALLKTKSISASVGDVSRELVVVNEIVVDGMTVNFELSPNGTNFDSIRKNLKAAKDEPASAKSETASGKPATKMIIHKLKIIHAQLIPSLGGVAKAVELPDITLNDIGSPAHPAMPVDVATQIMDKILKVAGTKALQVGLTSGSLDSLKAGVTEGLKGLFSK